MVLCRSRSDVEDVVQEAMLNAFQSYESFRGDSSFLTWAYRILVRTAHASNRKRSQTIPAEYLDSRPQPLPPVDRTVVLDEEVRGVLDALRSLPNRQREVMVLYLLEDCSYAEIASALDIAVGTVKATLYQAKQSLRAELARRGIVRKNHYELS